MTLLSSLCASLRLGLNFPLSLALSLGLRLLYAANPLRPVDVHTLPARLQRTQLVQVPVARPAYSRRELFGMCAAHPDAQRSGSLSDILDRAHILSFWSMAARRDDLQVAAADLRRFQTGTWEEDVAHRRRDRNDVLPFWRGDPLWVGRHSFAVGIIFGVRVYERS